MTRSLLPWVGVLLLGVAGFLGARYLSVPEAVPRIGPALACHLSDGPCRHALPDGAVLTLTLTPRPVPLMQPVRVVVTIDRADWRPLTGDITGLNMPMAPNRVRLEPAGPGRWEGETILPVCSQRQMHWQFALRLEGGGRSWQILDDFHTRR